MCLNLLQNLKLFGPNFFAAISKILSLAYTLQIKKYRVSMELIGNEYRPKCFTLIMWLCVSLAFHILENPVNKFIPIIETYFIIKK